MTPNQETVKHPPLSLQAAYVFVGKVSSFLFAFAVPIILVRIFSREDYGLYQQSLLIAMTMVEILKWGLINSLYYFYPLAKDKMSGLLSQTYYLILIIGAGFLPLMYLLRNPIADLFNSDAFLVLMWPIMVYFFFMLTALILDVIFILEKRPRTVVAYEIINQCVRVVLVVGSALIFKDITVTVWALSIFAILRSLCIFIYLLLNYKISPFKLDLSYMKEQLRYSFPIGSARMVGEIGKRFDKFLLSAFLTPANFAIYMVANLKIPLIRTLYQSIASVTVPKLTEYHHRSELKPMRELWHTMMIKYAVTTIPIVILLYFLAKEVIVLLYTDKYIESVLIFQILLLVYLRQILRPIVILRASCETKLIFSSHLISMIAAVILGYILIKNYGMVGGALSVVISTYIRAFILMAKAKSILKVKLAQLLPWIDLVKITVYSTAAASILVLIQSLHLQTIPKLIAAVSLYGPAVIGFALVFRYLDWKQLLSILRSGFKSGERPACG